jgi:hypothetical protein
MCIEVLEILTTYLSHCYLHTQSRHLNSWLVRSHHEPGNDAYT